MKKYSKDEIINYVRSILGNNVEGLFVNEEVVTGDIEPIDENIYSNITYPYLVDTKMLTIEAGITKLVIIPEETDYVIKIPFTGVYKYDDYENPVFKNYCSENVIEEEIDLYDFTISEALRSITAENIFICMLDDILPIYIQEKAKNLTSYCNFSSLPISETKQNIVKAVITKTNTDLNIDFVSKLISSFGIKKAYNLITEIDCYYTDLHNQNYGFKKDGSCMIFDYGGYDSNQWY
jgi:hypothetical protein